MARNWYDPTDVLSELHKVVQLGKLRYVAARPMGVPKHKVVDMDFTAPAYDFGQLFHTSHPMSQPLYNGRTVLDLYRDDGREACANSSFRLPHPKCLFVAGMDLDSSLPQAVWVVYAEEDGCGDVRLTIFVRYSPHWDAWMQFPFSIVLNKQTMEKDVLIYKSVFVGSASDQFAWKRGAAIGCFVVLAGVMLLQDQRAIEYVDVPTSNSHKKTSDRLTKQGKKPLAAVVHIKLLQPVRATLGKRLPSEPTGRKMPPHNRRGFYRHFKSGKVIWVPATKIHGGRPDQVVYHVEV